MLTDSLRLIPLYHILKKKEKASSPLWECMNSWKELAWAPFVLCAYVQPREMSCMQGTIPASWMSVFMYVCAHTHSYTHVEWKRPEKRED